MTTASPEGPREFRRIAIVNRGETAMRLIRAVRELSREEGESLRAIALVTEADRRALFAREADETWDLGAATFVDPADGRRKSRYLDYAGLERALRETRADAAWTGWGFVSEHAAFAELCRRLGVAFVGPDPEVMRRLGDKIASKRLAEEAGVPVAPWSGGPVESVEEARRHAERLGFPLMIKASAGGGGRGIRRVRDGSELAEAFEGARSESLKAFGDATVFIESLLEGSRHVEVQIIGDGQGTTWALGVRDCTIQRRNQKVLEETPSPALSPAQQRELCDAAVRLADTAGYRNAGTVEFLYDPARRLFSFMEVNTRLQVEHPVTEAVTGVDLVKLQLRVARGQRLEGSAPEPSGHAVEVRVNAEDPERGFAPAPGIIELLRWPGGPGVRVDSGFVEGDRVAPEFDSMLAKLVAHGRDRNEALARLKRGLLEMHLAVRGGASNKGFLLALLDRPEVQSGHVDVGWLDRLAAAEEHLPRDHAAPALLQAAIDACDAELALERARFYATASRGRPRLRAELGYDAELRHRGHSYAFRVFRTGPRDYQVDVDGLHIPVQLEHLGRLERRLRCGGREYRVLSLSDGLEPLVEVEGVPHRLSRDDARIVRSPAPAVVLSIAVEAGQQVAEGDRLCVLEAMKSELPVFAPFAGKVRQLIASPNMQVDTGAPLLVLEPELHETATTRARRVRFEECQEPEGSEGETARTRCGRLLEELRRLVLGFDVDLGEAPRLVAERRALCEQLAPDDPELLRGEDAILTAFADVCALFRRRGGTPAAEHESHSTEEYFFIYLRSLDPNAAGLPGAFFDRLHRALAHYGLDGLERSPELEEALLRVCKARQRVGDQVRVVLSILERRLDHVDFLAAHADEDLRRRLDRIVAATRGRYQAVSDLASEIRYRLFDRPFFDAVRKEVYATAEEHLRALAETGDAAEREVHWRALVECPQSLVGLISQRFETAEPRWRAPMLEVMTRRYYRIRKLQALRTESAHGLTLATAEYDHEGRHFQLFATCANGDELADAARALAPRVAAVPPERDVVIDFYLWRRRPHGEAERVEADLRATLEGIDFGRRVQRIVCAVSAPGAGHGMGAMQHFVFRPDPERPDGPALREERLVRGLHPMMGKRLQLWRLANFQIERLPSAEDVYLFYGTAHSNPKDARLFAFAEVRDLTPVRNDGGQVVRLPHLEMMLMEALAGVRRFQSRRTQRERLHWNRVLLYVWPPLELGPEELNQLAHRLAPATADLGLEKVVVRARMPDPARGGLRDTILQIGAVAGRGPVVSFSEPADEPIRPLSEYGQKVVRMRQRGMIYPYEVLRLMTPPRDGPRADFPPGEFREYDLDEAKRLVPVERAPGGNTCSVVVGRVVNFTEKQPDGMERVILLGDPSRDMGAFAEPECRRIIAALDLAEERGVPVEWFPVSAGARIAMDSGTENLDWTATALRRLVEFTQKGGEVNVVVDAINVGGQSYWNAEATMLMHTRGILVMTPNASMVLTGKKALDYSGGVSAEDHQGIGGYERVMGPNGQAQYWADDIEAACRILMRHYEHTYVTPGERFPRRAPTVDARDRDVGDHPHGRRDGVGFEHVGDVFSDETNPGRRKPFDIRRVMAAVIDRDHEPLERWRDMEEAEIAVIWDAHLGGIPVCLVGIESRPLPRLGFVPADGPEQWTPGSLFPLSSKKVARAVSAASGNRPVVILANLSGFDGSPESMRRLQLEYGAEIGRAVVNFKGPIVFCVISRYHGGAYVVFSRTLNENLQVAALEGSYASVIGGAPAAAVVFAADVDRRARTDPRLQELEDEIGRADEAGRGRLRTRWHELYASVRGEKLGEVAEQFDQIHSVQRALRVGSLHEILPPARLRPYLIEALERGIRRELERWRAASGAPPPP